jgi:iron complex outermembrane receptor protein
VGAYNFPGATFDNSLIGYYGPPRTITASLQFKF